VDHVAPSHIAVFDYFPTDIPFVHVMKKTVTSLKRIWFESIRSNKFWPIVRWQHTSVFTFSVGIFCIVFLILHCIRCFVCYISFTFCDVGCSYFAIVKIAKNSCIRFFPEGNFQNLVL
jgi:hypothetical protein